MAPQPIPWRTSDPAVDRQLNEFRDLLLRWNDRFNLTALHTSEEIDRRLIGDALLMLPALDSAVTNLNCGRLLDVGTGAGFPGLVLKIARPDLDLTLLEATGKKVDFLQNAITELGIEGVRAVHGRAEDFARNLDYRAQFDIVTARAVASLPALIELCTPFLRLGGIAMFPKGDQIEAELTAGAEAARLLGAKIVSSDPLPAIPGHGVTRLVIATKIALTPERYPRRSGLPAREPLVRIVL